MIKINEPLCPFCQTKLDISRPDEENIWPIRTCTCGAVYMCEKITGGDSADAPAALAASLGFTEDEVEGLHGAFIVPDRFEMKMVGHVADASDEDSEVNLYVARRTADPAVR